MLQNDLKLYAIIRGDLNMPPGKLAAQAGHAFTNAYLQAYNTNPEIAEQYECVGRIGTKSVLKAKSLIQIQKAKFEAELAGIPHSLITDSGHILPPHFDGNPIITALGIGPTNLEQARFLRKFNLMQ